MKLRILSHLHADYAMADGRRLIRTDFTVDFES